MNRLVASLFVLLCCGCTTTFKLEDRWSPLSEVIERPSLPFASDTATTTVGAHVYVTDLKQWLLDYPPGSLEFEALLLHERVHAKRQFSYHGLPGELAKTAWLGRYVIDEDFRWKEEQHGWYMTITHLHKNGAWTSNRTLSTAAAMAEYYKGLDGKRMVEFSVARSWIEDVIAGRWKPSE